MLVLLMVIWTGGLAYPSLGGLSQNSQTFIIMSLPKLGAYHPVSSFFSLMCQTYEGHTVPLLTSQMRKLRHRESGCSPRGVLGRSRITAGLLFITQPHPTLTELWAVGEGLKVVLVRPFLRVKVQGKEPTGLHCRD